jgi:hypothetical protein
MEKLFKSIMLEKYDAVIENYEKIYEWVDRHDLSRPKKNFARDFSDGFVFLDLIKLIHVMLCLKECCLPKY